MKLERFKEKDKKKFGIIMFTVCCIFLIAGVFFYKTFALFEEKTNLNIIEGQVQGLGDLYFAFYIDDTSSTTMPGRGDGYVLDTSKSTCNNGASVEWNTEKWGPLVTGLTQSRTKCTLYFEKYVPPINTATYYITNLESKGDPTLLFDNALDNNLRYVGEDPNNYVTFNNELWRIIGVMNNVSDDTGDTSPKLKIIRNEFYKAMAWDKTGKNSWVTSTCQNELNTTYYESLSDKDQIANVKWKLGGTATYQSNSDGLASHWYGYERGTTVYTGYETEWTGRIGLIYPSDYGFATDGGGPTYREKCLSVALFNWQSQTLGYCGKLHNWLSPSPELAWSLVSHSADNSTAFYVSSLGVVSRGTASDAKKVVFPTLYLKPDVNIVGGSGTESVPYQLE